MIEAEDIGLKIAENPREKLIAETIEATKEKILQFELNLELQRIGLSYLESQIKH
jgi:hypothetical protein